MSDAEATYCALGDVADTNLETLPVNTPSSTRFRYIDLSAVEAGFINWGAVAETSFGAAPSRARRVVKGFDVLFGTVRPNLKSHGFIGANEAGPLIASTGFSVIRGRDGVSHPAYLFHSLMSNHVTAQAVRNAIGSSYPALNDSDVRCLKIFLPSYGEQQRVSQVLDILGTAIHETEAIIAKLKAVKQGLLHDLLTRGIDANGELRPPQSEASHLYKESPLGWIPQEWAVLPFGSRVAVIDPNPSHRYPREQESGVPICSTENFDGEDDFRLEQSKKMPVSVFDFQNSRCDFADDQVIFARKGRIGLARRYGQERKVFSHTIVVLNRKSELTNQAWLLWLARSSAFLDGIRIKMNSNSGVPTLGIELINSVQTAFPPAFEQAHIARMLDSSSSRIRQEEQSLAALKRVRCGLMDDLLTGRIRVTPLLAEAAQQPGSA